jgi:hypothetical protein
LSVALVRKPRGRPVFVPAEEERVVVERMIGLGVPETEIARTLIRPAISVPTLRKHFHDEIERGRQNLKFRARALLLRAAEAGNVSAIMHLIARVDPEFYHMGAGGKVGVGADTGGEGPREAIRFYIRKNGREAEDDDDRP